MEFIESIFTSAPQDQSPTVSEQFRDLCRKIDNVNIAGEQLDNSCWRSAFINFQKEIDRLQALYEMEIIEIGDDAENISDDQPELKAAVARCFRLRNRLDEKVKEHHESLRALAEFKGQIFVKNADFEILQDIVKELKSDLQDANIELQSLKNREPSLHSSDGQEQGVELSADSLQQMEVDRGSSKPASPRPESKALDCLKTLVQITNAGRNTANVFAKLKTMFVKGLLLQLTLEEVASVEKELGDVHFHDGMTLTKDECRSAFNRAIRRSPDVVVVKNAEALDTEVIDYITGFMVQMISVDPPRQVAVVCISTKVSAVSKMLQASLTLV